MERIYSNIFFFFQNWYNVLKFEGDQFYQKETYLWLS